MTTISTPAKVSIDLLRHVFLDDYEESRTLDTRSLDGREGLAEIGLGVLGLLEDARLLRVVTEGLVVDEVTQEEYRGFLPISIFDLRDEINEPEYRGISASVSLTARGLAFVLDPDSVKVSRNLRQAVGLEVHVADGPASPETPVVAASRELLPTGGGRPGEGDEQGLNTDDGDWVRVRDLAEFAGYPSEKTLRKYTRRWEREKKLEVRRLTGKKTAYVKKSCIDILLKSANLLD